MKTRLPLLSLALLAWSTHAGAYNGGINGYSGNPATNAGMSCESCHSGGVMPTVDLSGPMSVTPGSTNTYVLRISGGQKLWGGLDVSATAGALAALAADTKLMGGEIVQTGKKMAVNDDVTFSFSWTAPQTSGMATLFGAGLSSDGSGPGGDEVARIALMVSVASLPPANQPPVADPGGPYSGTVGVPIAFDGSRSFDADGTLTAFAWDFGDGSSGAGAKPSHAYAAAGTYSVKLAVTDSKGATDMRTTLANINLGAPQNQPPTAFAGGPYSGIVGTPIALDGSGSKDPDGTIASYVWDFGDGSTGSGDKVMHTYGAPGSYQVVLTVVDDQGASASDATYAVARDDSAALLPVAVAAPRQVKIGPNNDRVAKIAVVVDLSGLPRGTNGCGRAVLLKNGQPVGTQDVCVDIKFKDEDDDADDDDRDAKKEKSKREHGTLRIKTIGGVIATARPWHGMRGRGKFSIPLTEADIPSVVWTARVELAGLVGDSAPVTTEVRKAGKP